MNQDTDTTGRIHSISEETVVEVPVEEATTQPTNQKLLSQEEVDAAIKTRLNRERKKWEAEYDERTKRDKLDAEERLKLELEDAKKSVSSTVDTANKRIIKAEAKSLAIQTGIKPERVDYALRLLDLSDVEVDEDGEPDSKTIEKALKALIGEFPELLVTATAPKAGNDFSTPNPSDKPLTHELIITMSPQERQRRMFEIENFYKTYKR